MCLCWRFGFICAMEPRRTRIQSRKRSQIKPGAAYFDFVPSCRARIQSGGDPSRGLAGPGVRIRNGPGRLRRVRPGGTNSRACWGLKWYPRPLAVSVYDRKPIAPDGLTEKDMADIGEYEEAAGESRGQTRPRARCRCPDGGERCPGVREEPRRTSEADSGRPWWAYF